MHGVGEKLKKRRLEKSLSLDEVYRQTKIQPHILEDLEEGKAINSLGPIYAKNFLRTYAQYLGLDVEKLLREYRHSQKPKKAKSEVVLEKRHKSFPQLKPVLIARIASSVILVIFLIFYSRFTLKRINEPSQDLKGPKVKIRVLPAEEVKTDLLILEVKALEDCWMRVKADEEELFQGILTNGKRKRWPAKDKIELRIGKPEALEVELNGQALDLKQIKVKRRLIVTHEGIVAK